MPWVIVAAMATAMINTAAAANTGRQRAASQSTIGSSTAGGTTVAHGPGRRAKTCTLATVSATSAIVPSVSSRGSSPWREAGPKPMSTGAMVTIPSASDANQRDQIANGGTVG